MFRSAAIALTALLAYLFSPLQDFASGLGLMHIATAGAASRGAGVVNTITITNKNRRAIRRYPLQFGRPFLAGAIPSGRCPVVAANGTALPTQADVKNRYPDGSASFAVVAVVLPSIPAGGAVQLSFAPGICSNTPLTAAQMLDASYNFDAAMTLVAPPVLGQVNSGVWPGTNGTIPAMQAVTNGGLKITINGHACDLEGLNFSADTTWAQVAATLTTPLSACAGATVTWVAIKRGVANNGFASAAGAVGYASAPTSGTDLAAFMALTQAAGATLQAAGPGGSATADARTMLQNGDYKLWTSGPVAQTIILADDTAARRYDLGLGDGFHPFRPRFEATFWPQTHQVFVRAIGENDLSTELEDLHYDLTITGGQSSPATEESLPGFTHAAMETWSKSFWLPGSGSGAGSGTPPAQVDIDNNLAYLESTRWVPNYDPSLTLSEATLASDYANWWANTNHDIGGSGAWNPGMASTGPRPDIGPEPSWDAAWLYGGDWRLRQTALGNADLAAAWPVNLRESGTGYRLNRTDPAGSSTGLGLPISQADRGALGPNGLEGGGEATFLGSASGTTSAVQRVGSGVCLTPGIWTACNGWNYASSHEPSPFFIPYVLTGDPFYLTEMENWAAYDQFASWQGNRGPTGGMADNELRGAGWMLRSRAEAAFAAPDNDPFKPYLVALTQSDIAAWEGAMGVSDPALSGTAEYQWAQGYGDPESQTNFGHPPPAPALGQWAASLPNVSPNNFEAQLASTNGTAYTANYMNWYVAYAVGRAAELGFAAKPLALYSGAYLTGLINGPDPTLIAAYTLPTMLTTGQITSFPALIASLATPWLTGVNYTGGSTQGPLPQQFRASLYAQGYNAYALAALSPSGR